MNKNLEEFIRKDIDTLNEDENLTKFQSDMLAADDDNWLFYANIYRQEAIWRAEKIVKENEEAGL